MPVYTFINELIINNQEVFKTNSSVHNINTTNEHHIHRSNVKLPCFQKSTFSAGTKIFNSMKILKYEKVKFKATYVHTPVTL
jgi:hypothetical protein